MVKDKETAQFVQKIILKTHEVLSFLKDGKIITAYEKLGGILKNLNDLHTLINQSDESTN